MTAARSGAVWLRSRWQLPVLAMIAVMAVLVPLASVAAPSRAEKRVALVIGVAAYRHSSPLANPINDARAIGEALRRLDFQVSELFDPDYMQFSRGLRDFGMQAQNADVSLVYFAGHGVQVDHENYLLPIDANLQRERDLLYEGVPLDLMLGEVAAAQKIGIVLLDACRTNPFVERITRSLTIAGRGINTNVGLARVDNVPRNTVVMMATKADEVSADGGNGHSPFAAALLAHFQLPGLELGLFLRSVRDTVLRATDNQQEPYIFSSLGAEPFYFHPLPPSRPPEIPPVALLNVLDTAGPTPLGFGRPTDPDGNTLSVRVTGLPRSGEVRINDRLAAANAVVSVEDLAAATYKPDGRTLGPVGTVDILVEDGRGGSVKASLPIIVLASPPIVEPERTVQVHPVPLGITPPRDPDGTPLTVVVTGLPRGVMRNGPVALKLGDRLHPEELTNLTFAPDPGVTGAAGTFRYLADDGRGNRTEGRVNVQVPDLPVDPEAMLWQRIVEKGQASDINTFLLLFPDSSLAGEARRRLEALKGTGRPEVNRRQAPDLASAGRPQQPTQANTRAPSDEPHAAPPPFEVASAAPRPTPPASAPAAPGPRAGAVSSNGFRDCQSCPVMMPVPAGSFIMGYGTREREAMPPHPVSLRAFAIGQYPVTVGEWKLCVADGGCGSMPGMFQPTDQTPVYNLSWDDTQQYTTWLSRRSGRKYRLPSEAEWEYAARGGTRTPYWWGKESGISLANCADCGGRQDRHQPLPVGAFKPNPLGLYDMLGGVAQWVADCWFPNYAGAPANGAARDAKGCPQRVLRGGSFRSMHDDITVMARDSYDAPVRYIVNGFRVARDLD